MKYRLPILFCLCCVLATGHSARAQYKEVNTFFEFSSGASFGFWRSYSAYRTALITDDQTFALQSPKAFSFPLELNIIHQLGLWKIGTGFRLNTLEANMTTGVNPNLNRVIRERFATNRLQLYQWNIQSELDLVRNKAYTLSPNVQLGVFWMNTTHPDRNTFKSRSFVRLGFANQFDIANRWQLVFTPHVSVLMIDTSLDTRHRIYLFGCSAGIRYGVRW
jgi:hypothetical protein